VPVLPGSDGPVGSIEEALATVEHVGFPVIIKAAAGGGGRGMRVVHSREELLPALKSVWRDAQTLFNDSRLYIERYVSVGRHVEVQILADDYGRAVHLGVRDCSVQRRHQKLIEESPAPGLPEDAIERMCEAAVSGAKAIGYVGAGTFEFIVDSSAEFYFMEANCRIQVEHPVTEMVTGVDLIQEQLRIASGEPLAFAQEEVVNRGVAVECRINTEDPERALAPTPGRIESLALPGGPFVRVDTHGHAGYRIPALYDPLLAKVIVWAPTREEALARMDRALWEFRVTGPGIRTTADFLRKVLVDPRFRGGVHDTGVVDQIVAEG